MLCQFGSIPFPRLYQVGFHCYPLEHSNSGIHSNRYTLATPIESITVETMGVSLQYPPHSIPPRNAFCISRDGVRESGSQRLPITSSKFIQCIMHPQRGMNSVLDSQDTNGPHSNRNASNASAFTFFRVGIQ